MSNDNLTGIFIIVIGVIIALLSATQISSESTLVGLVGILLGAGVAVWGCFRL